MTGGYSGSSMFYMVLVLLSLYVIGMGAYFAVQKIRKLRDRKRDERLGK